MSGLAVRCTLERGAFTLDAAFGAPARGVTGVFGPSGAGKTTLLRAIAGLDRGRGAVTVGDACWQDDERGIFVPTHRRAVGLVFQEASLFAHRSVRGNLEYGWRRVPAGDRTLDFDQVVDWLGLARLLTRTVEHLSGGERQRVAIARALVASPHLLLMDEPLASLDAAAKAEILPYLERLHDTLAVPVVYVSHAQGEVLRLADHLVVLDAGRVIAAGAPESLATRLDLPLAVSDQAEAVVAARVAAHDPEYHLTYLDFPGGRFSVPREDLAVGASVRVRVPARDVSLTLDPPGRTSVLNVVRARVVELARDGAAQLLVRLDAGGAPLLARITRKSGAALGLEPGVSVYAQVKGVALVR